MIPKLSECKAGIRPVGYNVLIAVKTAEEVTKGGIILPEDHIDKKEGDAEYGRIISISDMAFTGGDWALLEEKPKCDDVVFFQRYQGREVKGDDGKAYRLIPDEAIYGVKADG